MNVPASWLALIIGGPVLALAALDRAIVLWDAQWQWAAHEMPATPFSAYKADALVRTWESGAADLVVIGNSRADAALDPAILEPALAGVGPGGQSPRVRKLTLGRSRPATFGFLAETLIGLEPWAVVLMTGAAGLNDEPGDFQTVTYDVRAIPALFTAGEVARAPLRHLDGLVSQAHVLARHRGALQRVMLVRSGWLSFEELEQLRRWRTGGWNIQDRWKAWVSNKEHVDVYPNPNTRAIEHLARRLRVEGIRFLVLEAPTQLGVEALIGFDRTERMREELSTMAEREGFAFVPSDDYPDIAPDDWEDMVHLEPSGQKIFSEAIADPLRSLLAAPPS